MLKKTVLAVAIFGLAATAVQANEMTGYATYSIGHAKADKPKIAKEVQDIYQEIGGRTSTDRASTGYKIALGLNVHEYIALEAQYIDLGQATYKGNYTPAGMVLEDKLNLKTSGFGANIVGKYPIQDFTVFAKAGYHLMRTKATVKDIWIAPGWTDIEKSSKTISKWAPSFGVGASYNLTSELSVVAEYERYQDIAKKKVNFDDEKVSFKHSTDFLSLGLRYNF